MKTYEIEKGDHRSGFRFSPVFKPLAISGQFKFHENCLYEPFKGPDSNDINKLCGISMRTSPFTWNGRYLIADLPHHIDSFIIGWRNTQEIPEDNLEILTYVHIDGEFHFKSVFTVPTNVIVNYSAYRDFDSNKWMVNFNTIPTTGENKSLKLNSKESGKSIIGYKLYPWFGGNSESPVNMSMEVSTKVRSY